MLSEIIPPIPAMIMLLFLFVATGNLWFFAALLAFSALLVKTVNEEIAWRDEWDIP